MRKVIDEHLSVIQAIDEALLAELEQVVQLCVKAVGGGKTLFFCGNGGSAADAQHLAAEFVVRFQKTRRAMAAVALTTDTSILTACGNDYSFNEIFARQIEALGKPGDVLFAISTSGTSANIVRAAEEAQLKGVKVVAITGSAFCVLDHIADTLLKMPSLVTARVQECYLLLGHILCGEVEQRIVESENDRKK